MPTATATPTGLKGMVAVGKDSGIKPLGYVVWFSVPDQDIKANRLRQHWLTAGLDPKPLPPAQKSVNAFKRAVRKQEGIVRNEQDGTVTETDVRDLEETSDEVVYQVSRVVRDLNDRVVNYPKAIRVWFTKQTEEIDFKPLGEVPTKDAFAIMDGITAAYDEASDTVTGSKVRTIVRHYLKDDIDERDNMYGMSAQNLRGKAGGVYFVLAKHEHELERLSEMLWKLYKPAGRAYLHMIPMADGASERELIRRHLEMEAADEIKVALAERAELMRDDRSRGVRKNVRDFHIRKLGRIIDRQGEYAKALHEEMDESEWWLKQGRKTLAAWIREQD